MTREEKSLCPVCGKKKSRMASHFAISHPELNRDDYGVTGPAVTGEAVSPPAAFAPLHEEARPAAPAEPLEDPSVVQAINSLVTHIERQATIIQSQQERIEAIGKDLSTFQQSVLQNLNEVPKVVHNVVTAQLDQMVADAQARAAAAEENGQGQPGMVEMPQPAMSNRPDPMELLTKLAPLFIGQPKPAGGDIMAQLAIMKQVAEIFNPMPAMMTGMQLMSTMINTASKTGAPARDIGEGGDRVIESLRRLSQPHPPHQEDKSH